MGSSDDHDYHPQDTIRATINSTLFMGGVGTFASAVQNTLAKQNVGPMGIFTRTGGTIGIFAAAGGAYKFCHLATSNLREKDDSFSHAVGGFFAGSLIGFQQRSLPRAFGYGGALAVIVAAFQYTGGSLRGHAEDPEVDEVARKEFMRKNRRRPFEETLEQLGEGRGIYPEGYEQRRREKLKAKYGLDLEGIPPAH